MYFGTGEGWYNIDAVRGLGIWKSTDGGVNWNQLSSTNNADFYRIQKLVVEADGDVFACTRQGGLQRSQDGGSTWTKVLGEGVNSVDNGGPLEDALVNPVSDLEIDASGNLYCGMGLIFFSDGIYKSIDGGDTWTKLGGGLPSGTNHQRVEIACAPSDVNRVYAMFQHASTYQCEGFYRSDDAGSTWTKLTTPSLGSQCWYNMVAAVDPSEPNKVFAAGVGFFRSTDGGTSWTSVSGMHVDHHIIVYQAGSSDIMYVGNDGGIYRSINASQALPSYSSRNLGYNVTQYYTAALHPTAGTDYFIAGSQDNGTRRYTLAGMNSTSSILGGDGSFCHIDQLEPDVQIGSYLNGQLYISTNSFTSYRAVNIGSVAWSYNPTDYDSRDQTLYAAGTAGTYKTLLSVKTNNTANTHSLTELSSQAVTAVSVSPKTENRIFLGTQQGRIVQVDDADGSPSATYISDGSATYHGGSWPSGYVSSIAVDEEDDNHLLVSFSNFGVWQMWETSDGGSNWYNRTGDLPDMPVRWAMFYPKDSRQAILATELGVWTTDDLQEGGGPDWEPSHDGSTGFPNVRTDMLQYRESDRTLIAATHGRGVFSATLPCPVPENIPTTQGVYTADRSCTDSDGWTYFWNSSLDLLLLAIKDIASSNAVILPAEVQVELTSGHGADGHQINSAYVTNPNGWYVMGRYFNVNPSQQPDQPLSVRFYYDATSYQDIVDAIGGSPGAGTLSGHTDLVFYKLANGKDPNPANGHTGVGNSDIQTYTHGASPSLTNWTYAAYGIHHQAEWMVSGFSGGGGGAGGDGNGSGPGSPLPVEWLHVRGWPLDAGRGVQLSWDTGEEINLDYFEIERMGQAGEFHPLGQVFPNATHSYSFIDPSPWSAQNIYRIKQVDFNGNFSHSPRVEVFIGLSTKATLYPNPVQDVLNIQLAGVAVGAQAIFRCYDVRGSIKIQKTWSVSATQNPVSLSLSGLASGSYRYELLLGGVRLEQGQVVKY